MRRFATILVLLFVWLAPANEAHALEGQEHGSAHEKGIKQQGFVHRMHRLLDLNDTGVANMRRALLGSVLLGISCGLLGSFIVVRRMALFGDTLSHAVLPGIMFGFLATGLVVAGAGGLLVTADEFVNAPLESLKKISSVEGGISLQFSAAAMTKNPILIFLGATAAGLLGGMAVTFIRRATRLKEDTALGLVLASFYAFGVCLLTRIQDLESARITGLTEFMFGQAALLSSADLKLMAVVAGLSLLIVFVFYKELLLTSFDHGYAQAAGFPVRAIQYTLMLLLAFSVVVALQAVGVVLVSALLITPAATAYMLTDRMHRMMWLSVAFGIFAGVSGALMSFFFDDLPTGPFMVLGATFAFVLAFLFSPRHGVLVRWVRHRSRTQRVQRENTLKAIYHVLEARDFEGEGVSLRELAERRYETEEDARQQTAELAHHNLATLHDEGNAIHLTPGGWQRACEIVRNHRLWELYLTNEAKIAPDHVHDDAEVIEHVLGEEVIRKLERTLNHASTDPHGRPIPGIADLKRGLAPEGGPGEILGYGGRL